MVSLIKDADDTTATAGRERKELNDTVNEEQIWNAFEKEREVKMDDLDLIL